MPFPKGIIQSSSTLVKMFSSSSICFRNKPLIWVLHEPKFLSVENIYFYCVAGINLLGHQPLWQRFPSTLLGKCWWQSHPPPCSSLTLPGLPLHKPASIDVGCEWELTTSACMLQQMHFGGHWEYRTRTGGLLTISRIKTYLFNYFASDKRVIAQYWLFSTIFSSPAPFRVIINFF